MTTEARITAYLADHPGSTLLQIQPAARAQAHQLRGVLDGMRHRGLVTCREAEGVPMYTLAFGPEPKPVARTTRGLMPTLDPVPLCEGDPRAARKGMRWCTWYVMTSRSVVRAQAGRLLACVGDRGHLPCPAREKCLALARGMQRTRA